MMHLITLTLSYGAAMYGLIAFGFPPFAALLTVFALNVIEGLPSPEEFQEEADKFGTAMVTAGYCAACLLVTGGAAAVALGMSKL